MSTAKPVVALLSDEGYPHGNPEKPLIVMVEDPDEKQEMFVVEKGDEMWTDEIAELESGEVLPLWK